MDDVTTEIDLSQVSKSLLRLDQKDVVVALATGGIGLLIKKMIDVILSPPASIPEQLDALRRLIESSRAAGVKKISAKMSQPAFTQFMVSANDMKIDLIRNYQEACSFTIEFV